MLLSFRVAIYLSLLFGSHAMDIEATKAKDYRVVRESEADASEEEKPGANSENTDDGVGPAAPPSSLLTSLARRFFGGTPPSSSSSFLEPKRFSQGIKEEIHRNTHKA